MAKLKLQRTVQLAGFEEYHYMLTLSVNSIAHGYVRFIKSRSGRKWSIKLYKVSNDLKTVTYSSIKSIGHSTLKANKTYFKSYMETVYG